MVIRSPEPNRSLPVVTDTCISFEVNGRLSKKQLNLNKTVTRAIFAELGQKYFRSISAQDVIAIISLKDGKIVLDRANTTVKVTDDTAETWLIEITLFILEVNDKPATVAQHSGIIQSAIVPSLVFRRCVQYIVYKVRHDPYIASRHLQPTLTQAYQAQQPAEAQDHQCTEQKNTETTSAAQQENSSMSICATNKSSHAISSHTRFQSNPNPEFEPQSSTYTQPKRSFNNIIDFSDARSTRNHTNFSQNIPLQYDPTQSKNLSAKCTLSSSLHANVEAQQKRIKKGD